MKSDAALPATRESFGTWEDISTAPRDGTCIVLTWPATDEVDSWFALTGRWEKHRWWPGGGSWVTADSKKSPALFWAPLPKYPPDVTVPTGSESDSVTSDNAALQEPEPPQAEDG